MGVNIEGRLIRIINVKFSSVITRVRKRVNEEN